MIRLATFVIWLNMTKTLFWNVGIPEPGEWMLWAGDWVKCDGRYHVAANWDREGWTFTLVDDFDRELEPDCWEWRIERSL
jgi:hypothetical protein